MTDDRDKDDIGIPARASAAERLYFEWVASLPCLVSHAYGVQVAHIRSADALWGKRLPGTGRKPLLPYVVPLAPDLHREQEAGNWSFWERHGFPREPMQHSVLFHAWALWRIYRAERAQSVGGVGAAYIRGLIRPAR